MSHAAHFFGKARQATEEIRYDVVDGMAAELAALRERGGRLFLIGVGGSAGNCGHAVNDFRKLCGIEAYAPTDNVSELTARANDEGWTTIFAGWLRTSRLGPKDALLVLSVGGGNEARGVSVNIIEAVKLAKERGAKVFAVVGRPDGYAAEHGDVVVAVPIVDEKLTTPMSEAFQALVWHCLVSSTLR